MRLTLTPSPVVSSVLKFARSPTSAPRRSSSWITPGWRRRMAPALAVQGLFRPRHLQGSVGSLKKHVPKSVHPAELTREPALRAPSPGRSTGRCPRRGHLPEGRCCLDSSSGKKSTDAFHSLTSSHGEPLCQLQPQLPQIMEEDEDLQVRRGGTFVGGSGDTKRAQLPYFQDGAALPLSQHPHSAIARFPFDVECAEWFSVSRPN